MRLNSAKIPAIIILAAVILLALAGVAVAAPPWSDASNSWWVSSYGVTETEVATVADGYPDGTFRPNLAVTRGQFAKMAVNGLDIDTANPTKATFKDVIPSNIFYVYVEGAYAAGLIGGYQTSSGLLYKPNNTITRQQANSILGRYLSKIELDNTGAIHGDVNNYGSLELWYNAEGKFYLNGFEDANKVVSDHRATTAYLVRRGIVKGSNNKLNPLSTLVRSQAAVMVLRVKAEAEDILTPPTAPTNLGVIATGTGVQVIQTATTAYAGNDPTPQVTGNTLADSDIAIYDEPFYGSSYIKLDTSNASGMFYADLDDPTKPLVDGTHSLTAKVKNENGLVSPASAPVVYVLDTAPPSGSITAPVVAPGTDYAAVNEAKPAFTVSAGDTSSGVKTVEFQVAADVVPLAWTTVSVFTNGVPVKGPITYSAVWPSTGSLAAGLTDGDYRFQAIIKDLAGNTRITDTLMVKVDTSSPTVTMTAPASNSGDPLVDIFYTEDGAPTFMADASDSQSGVAKVEFLYWRDPVASGGTPGPTTWEGFTLLSSDSAAPYVASYADLGGAGLAEGRYIFAVRATDNAGNLSALMSGSAYLANVTQEVVIDRTAPAVTITAPVAGQLVPDGTPFTITWTLTDQSAPTTVSIEYSPTGSAPWTTVTAAAPFAPGSTTGSYQWTGVPDISGADVTTYMIRITAVDKAGGPVSDVPGHTTIATSGMFTLYDAPLAATGLVGADADASVAGVDGRDLSATWTVSASPHIGGQKVYVLPDGQTLVPATDLPVAVFTNNTVAAWSGTSALTTDSRGVALADGNYKVWVVVSDLANRTATASSPAFPVSAP